MQFENTVFCEFSLQLSSVVYFSRDDKKKRLVHATARSVGGSMTLNLGVVSL